MGIARNQEAEIKVGNVLFDVIEFRGLQKLLFRKWFALEHK
jgi:hypothetical protein